MIPERCERFREFASLGVDGMLSKFETALLDRHLAKCGPCRAFAAGVRAQTAALRGAHLETPAEPFVFAAHGRSRLGRRIGAAAGAVAVAASAALIAVAPTARHESPVAQATQPLFKVVAEQPSPLATFEVPRLVAVSPASADGPVRGFYGVPA